MQLTENSHIIDSLTTPTSVVVGFGYENINAEHPQMIRVDGQVYEKSGIHPRPEELTPDFSICIKYELQRVRKKIVGKYEIHGNQYVAIAVNRDDPKDSHYFDIDPEVNNDAFVRACGWAYEPSNDVLIKEHGVARITLENGDQYRLVQDLFEVKVFDLETNQFLGDMYPDRALQSLERREEIENYIESFKNWLKQ